MYHHILQYTYIPHDIQMRQDDEDKYLLHNNDSDYTNQHKKVFHRHQLEKPVLDILVNL